MTVIVTNQENNHVGPVMRQGKLARAVAEAAKIDNPDKIIIVDDKVAYLPIQTEGDMIIRRQTVEETLGRPFHMRQLEVDLSSFAGKIDLNSERVRFYFDKILWNLFCLINPLFRSVLYFARFEEDKMRIKETS